MAKIRKASELLPTVETDFIDRSLDDILIPVYRDVPYTEIENRAQMLDPEKNLESWFGVDRKIIQDIAEVQGEYGPNGEKVFKPVNDDSERVRFVGSFVSNFDQFTNDTGLGGYINFSEIGDYIEITIYGTGLNLLLYTGNDVDLRYSLDGGSESADINTQSAFGGRGYKALEVLNIEQNLAQGIHHFKIRYAGGGNTGVLYGFEILNETSTIKTMSGSHYIDGKSVTLSESQTYAYNSGFDTEYGTNTNDGGKVITYLKDDGTLERVIRWADASPQYLTNTDHTNEEISSQKYWREFGNGLSYPTFDFLNATATQNCYVLDDNMTYLHAYNASWSSPIGSLEETLYVPSVNNFIMLGFYGTGLDILGGAHGTTLMDEIEVFVDGSSVGSLSTVAKDIEQNYKICSNLPLGFHTVKLNVKTNNTNNFGLRSFVIYRPKTPSYEGVLLSSYYLNADFIANSTASILDVSTGVTRKTMWREFRHYQGTGGTTDWNIGALSELYMAAIDADTDRLNGYLEIPFYGTGFDFRFRAHTNHAQTAYFTLNGLELNTTNFPGISGNTSVYGDGANLSFTDTTGILDQRSVASNVQGCGFVCSGLPLGHYTLKVNNNTVSEILHCFGLDVISPVYSPVTTNFTVNTINREIGNSSIQNDVIKHKIHMGVGQSEGLVVGLDNWANSSFRPSRFLATTIELKERSKVSIKTHVNIYDDGATGNPKMGILINGIHLHVENKQDASSSGNPMGGTIVKTLFLEKGFYHITAAHGNNSTGSIETSGGIIEVEVTPL